MKRLILLGFLLTMTLPLLAQTQARTVTDDAVYDIAEHMFCPICENEPLDECRNQTCLQWKAEIQRQLEEGRTEEEIINYFVERYGQKVVSVPQDPLLQALSFVLPIIGALLGLAYGQQAVRTGLHRLIARLAGGAYART